MDVRGRAGEEAVGAAEQVDQWRLGLGGPLHSTFVCHIHTWYYAQIRIYEPICVISNFAYSCV